MTVVMIKEFLKKIVMLTDAGMFEHVHTLVLTDKSIHDLPQLNTTMSEHFGLFAEHLSFEFYPVNHHLNVYKIRFLSLKKFSKLFLSVFII